MRFLLRIQVKINNVTGFGGRFIDGGGATDKSSSVY
jgi:hypothetical protein